jgi:hypothetical protein
MENISVGDLVMVVKPSICCRNKEMLGKTFTVTGYPIYNKKQCIFCLDYREIHTEVILNNNFVVEKERLKKIPPLSELEDTKTQKTLEV